jgi:hypothetical protein
MEYQLAKSSIKTPQNLASLQYKLNVKAKKNVKK